MISDVVPPTEDPLFVLESCHSTWIFDTDRMRFRRVLKGLTLDAHAATTAWRAYFGLEIDPISESFVVLLNPEGTRLLRSWRHVEHCPQCGGNQTAELSLDELGAPPWPDTPAGVATAGPAPGSTLPGSPGRAGVAGGRRARSRVRRRTTSGVRCPGPRPRRPGARVMITKATVQRTAMVPSLATNPASCWSRSGVMPTTVPEWRERGVQGVAGEDPHDREEARHDRLHDEVTAPPERGQARCSGELGQHRRPQHEARRQHHELEPDRATSERAARLHRAGRSGCPPPPRSPRDGRQRPDAPRAARRRRRPAGSDGPRAGRGVPRTRSGGTASVRSRRWTTSAISSQWAARSASGQVTAASQEHRTADEEDAVWPHRRGVASRRVAQTYTATRAGTRQQPDHVEMPVEGVGGGVTSRHRP